MKEFNDDMQTDADVTIEISDATKLPKAPAVSVVMLAYQHEKFIEQAIKGVIAQDCNFPIELIIGEDCSADRTREIVLHYQRRYPHIIRVLTSRKNVGMHANSERCSNACRGEFIAPCEGDDYWQHPRKLQMQFDLMKSHPDMDLCHTDYDRIIRNRFIRDHNKNFPSRFLAEGNAYIRLLEKVSVVTATSMYRRNILDKIKGKNLTSDKWQFGDYPLTLFAAARGPVGYIQVSTATYRHVEGSATNSGRAKALSLELGVLDCRERFLSAFPVPKQIDRRLRVEFHENLMWSAALANNKKVFLDMKKWLQKNNAKTHLHVLLLGQLFIHVPLALKIYRTIARIVRNSRRSIFWKRLQNPR